MELVLQNVTVVVSDSLYSVTLEKCIRLTGFQTVELTD